MPNNAEVAAALAPDKDWRTAYPFVEAKARAILDIAGPQSYSTSDLADLIYSPHEAHDAKVRKRVFQALAALSTRSLQRYVTLGEPERIGAAMQARRKTWHAPTMEISTPVKCCPTCKRPL